MVILFTTWLITASDSWKLYVHLHGCNHGNRVTEEQPFLCVISWRRGLIFASCAVQSVPVFTEAHAGCVGISKRGGVIGFIYTLLLSTHTTKTNQVVVLVSLFMGMLNTSVPVLFHRHCAIFWKIIAAFELFGCVIFVEWMSWQEHDFHLKVRWKPTVRH